MSLDSALDHNDLSIVKIGADVILSSQTLNKFLKCFHKISGPKILVHGGGKCADDVGKKLGITPCYQNGRRITNEETMNLVTMVYGGTINGQLVAGLQKLGCNAIGLKGGDGKCIISKKRPSTPKDFGFVGDIELVNTKFMSQILNLGLIPVVSPLTLSTDGEILNTNADSIAGSIAQAFCTTMTVSLTFATPIGGVFKNISDSTSVLEKIDSDLHRELVGLKVVSNGMIPKLENGFKCLQNGVHRVKICSPFELATKTSGTTLSKGLSG